LGGNQILRKPVAVQFDLLLTQADGIAWKEDEQRAGQFWILPFRLCS